MPNEQMKMLIHGEGGVLDLIWAFVEGAIGIEPIITRIGKAFRDGELKLPGEVGRWIGLIDGEVVEGAEEDEKHLCIALSPTGTGKEEEK